MTSPICIIDTFGKIIWCTFPQAKDISYKKSFISSTRKIQNSHAAAHTPQFSSQSRKQFVPGKMYLKVVSFDEKSYLWKSTKHGSNSSVQAVRYGSRPYKVDACTGKVLPVWHKIIVESCAALII